MSLEEYLKHYLVGKEMLQYLVVALIGALTTMLLILVFTRLSARGETRFDRRVDYYRRSFNIVQRFEEMILSATSILSFLAIFYLIDRFVPESSFRTFWDKWRDFILLFMIFFSCLINNYMDRWFIPLKKISRKDKSAVRLTGMFYIMIIFMYIKFIYENDNYDGFIMYFLGLMIGRFVYFDASLADFVDCLKSVGKNIPILILGLAYTSFMCIYGFETDYLLVSNGVLVSTFFAHMFMVVAIFVLHHSHLMSLFVRKPKRIRAVQEDDYEEYDEYGDSYAGGEEEYYGEDSEDYYRSEDEYEEDEDEYVSDEYYEDDNDGYYP